MTPELIIHLEKDIEIRSASVAYQAGDNVHILNGSKIVWRRTATEIAKDPSKFLADFAVALCEYVPCMCRQIGETTVVELENAWLAIDAGSIGIYETQEAASTFGNLDSDEDSEIAYWIVDEIKEDPGLVIGAILGAISTAHTKN